MPDHESQDHPEAIPERVGRFTGAALLAISVLASVTAIFSFVWLFLTPAQVAAMQAWVGGALGPVVTSFLEWTQVLFASITVLSLWLSWWVNREGLAAFRAARLTKKETEKRMEQTETEAARRQHLHLADAIAIHDDVIGLEEDGTVCLTVRLTNHSAYEAVTVRAEGCKLEFTEVHAAPAQRASDTARVRMSLATVEPTRTVASGKTWIVRSECKGSFAGPLQGRLFEVSGLWVFSVTSRDGTVRSRKLSITRQQRAIRLKDPSPWLHDFGEE